MHEREREMYAQKRKWKSVCQQNAKLEFHPVWFLVTQAWGMGMGMAHAPMNLWSVESAAALKFNKFYQNKMLCAQVKISVGRVLFIHFFHQCVWLLWFVKCNLWMDTFLCLSGTLQIKMFDMRVRFSSDIYTYLHYVTFQQSFCSQANVLPFRLWDLWLVLELTTYYFNIHNNTPGAKIY